MSKKAAMEARKIFDKELDKATDIVLNRWKRMVDKGLIAKKNDDGNAQIKK